MSKKEKLSFCISDWVMGQKLPPLETIVLGVLDSASTFKDSMHYTTISNASLMKFIDGSTVSTVRQALFRLKQKGIIKVYFGHQRKTRKIVLNKK